MIDHDQVERVARALCSADGVEPDTRVPVDDMHVVEAEFGIAVTAPAWTAYAGEARRFIAGARALGLLE